MMVQKAKYLYGFLFLCGVWFSAAHAQEDQKKLYNDGPVETIKNRYTAKKMNSMDFSPPKPEKEPPFLEPEEKEEPKTETFKAVNDRPEDKKTEGHKLWEKYKELADQRHSENEKKKEDKVPEPQNNDDTTEAEETETDAPQKTAKEALEPSDVKPANGLSAILEQYKQSKTEKKPISTRSFGSID